MVSVTWSLRSAEADFPLGRPARRRVAWPRSRRPLPARAPTPIRASRRGAAGGRSRPRIRDGPCECRPRGLGAARRPRRSTRRIRQRTRAADPETPSRPGAPSTIAFQPSRVRSPTVLTLASFSHAINSASTRAVYLKLPPPTSPETRPPRAPGTGPAKHCRPQRSCSPRRPGSATRGGPYRSPGTPRRSEDTSTGSALATFHSRPRPNTASGQFRGSRHFECKDNGG